MKVLLIFLKIWAVIFATLGLLSSSVPGYSHYWWMGLTAGAVLWFGPNIISKVPSN